MKQSLLTLKIFLLVGKLGAMFFQGSKGSHNIEALQISLRKFLLSFFLFFCEGLGTKGLLTFGGMAFDLIGLYFPGSLLLWLIILFSIMHCLVL